jgi:pilus assembly protein CpaB
MRARTLILLIVALVLAGGTTMMARVWLASQRQTAAEAAPIAMPMPAKSVLVARGGIQRGQLLKPDDLMWEPWPEGGVDKNYILLGTRTPDAFAGWVARLPISGGEPLTESKIVAPGNRGFLAAVLRAGTRAVSVPINITSGISGFIFPGDQVDLVITYSVQETPKAGVANPGPMVDHKVSETVLHDIRVIGIDQKLDSKAGETNPNLKTATLEVTPKQSEIIALATEMGKLSLSLRSLVPGPGETKHEIDQSLADAPSTPLSETYTVDSDISPLLRNPFKKGGSTEAAAEVTILRGNSQSSSTSVVTQPKTGG